MTHSAFSLVAIEPSAADELRARGGPTYVADRHPGFPCRQCLRDAEVGEELILVSHDPFTGTSPYRCASPIFLHRSPCSPYVDSAELPAQLTLRQLSVRAFDDAEMMLDAALIDGTDLHDTIVRLLGDPAIHRLHVHNASRGCWAANVERVATDAIT